MSETQNETPTWAKVINDAIERKLLDLHVSMPAEILTYDGTKANVRPLLKRQLRDQDKTEIELPVITNVPVIWLATIASEIALPLGPGDTGTLLFCERSLDTWLVQGGSVNPQDFRKFNLSDAQFIPGLRPFDIATSHDPERAVFRAGLSLLTLKLTGQLKFTNGVVELMDLVSQLIEKVSETNANISTSTTNTVFGPLTFNDFAAYIVREGEVDTIGLKWDTLKE